MGFAYMLLSQGLGLAVEAARDWSLKFGRFGEDSFLRRGPEHPSVDRR